jgi:hypothetical protein
METRQSAVRRTAKRVELPDALRPYYDSRRTRYYWVLCCKACGRHSTLPITETPHPSVRLLLHHAQAHAGRS